MPRQARLDTPGALHHIMVRGINRSQIFDDDEDRSRFLTRLGENILKTHSSLYAWALMETSISLLRLGRFIYLNLCTGSNFDTLGFSISNTGLGGISSRGVHSLSLRRERHHFSSFSLSCALVVEVL
ncbi:MAG: hypothetical protein FJ117_11290 [Deltaproteobacteria bacterium]|nr:hypothetical protein [Deltaproteobacteria bacterium]